MAHAVISSPFQACCRLSWKGEVSYSRQDLFMSKSNLSVKNLLPTGSPSEGSSAIRSSLDSASTDDFQGRYASGCLDPLCALSCPVHRDTYVQRWLEESVHEIVRNIQEAPFLQYVFDSKGRLCSSHRLKISKELLKNPDRWTGSPLRESLSKVDLDGIILVQKLEPECSSAYCLAEGFQSSNEESETVCRLQGEGAETNVWGVLVQARGVNANACYLLKTTRVSSSAGICTRYCLTRAKCFGPSYVHQLENAWLL
ncbi:hypothetical protein M758_2G160200 [Ceratodon purpureus]|nr:hypothetical protein M758_2G160200 [Ceratodon purpureus]